MSNSIIKDALIRVFSMSKLGNSTVKGQADSGLNIDHMYRKSPKGVTFFGRFLDSILLNLPSVKATRTKKEIIIKILQNEVANNMILGKKTRIIDLASGPARYLVDLINESNCDSIEALCLDSDKRSINYGRILSHKKPIRYTKANVFKLSALKHFSDKVHWTPNIVIATGFFELQKDAVVKMFLEDIHKHLDIGGLILFTGQVDNPSKKLMKYIGKTQSGEAWELYLRSPEIFRKWLLDAGFRDVIISLDNLGMYEYCTGRKT